MASTLSKNDPLYAAKLVVNKAAKKHAEEMREIRIAKYMKNPALQFETLTGWDYVSRTWYQRQAILNEAIDNLSSVPTSQDAKHKRSNTLIALKDALEAEKRMTQLIMQVSE